MIACAADHPHHIALPRGCLDDLRQVLSDLKVAAVIRDERHCGKPLNLTFEGELRPEQQVAADAMFSHDIGVLSATTAFGKTVIGAWLIAANCRSNGSRGCRCFSESPRVALGGSEADAGSRPELSTWRSFKACSARVSSTT
jgi:hypothetical protein